jgi:Protein of unknown function (DUF2786)
MNLPPPKVCVRIHKLHAMLGSSNAKEAENARAKLNRLLAEHGLTWNDLQRSSRPSMVPIPGRPMRRPTPRLPAQPTHRL